MSKVRMGAKYPRFSKITSEPEGVLPVYGEKITTIGELIAANLTINYASGELYSDDSLNIKVDEFSSGAIAMENDGLESEVYEALFGATVDEDGVVSHSAEDVAPCGGLGYYTRMRDKAGNAYFEGHFFPKVQAALSGANASTKGNSVTFTTANVTFTVMRCESGAFWLHQVCDTEAEAKAWVNAHLTTATN